MYAYDGIRNQHVEERFAKVEPCFSRAMSSEEIARYGLANGLRRRADIGFWSSNGIPLPSKSKSGKSKTKGNHACTSQLQG